MLTRVLELEFGESRLQYYGLFENALDSGEDGARQLFHGQARFMRELAELAQKQAATGRLLIKGDTLLPLAKLLAAEGKTVYWIGSEELRSKDSESEANFHYAGDDFIGSQQPDSIDLLIVAGSLCYQDQMAILSKSRDILGNSGRLLLFGEFIHDDSSIAYSELPNLTSFEQLSRRLGFELIENRDLSVSASRTLELVAPLLSKHGATLLADAEVDDRSMEDLQLAFSCMQQEFATGRRGFNLWILGRAASANEWANAEFGDILSFQPLEVADLFEKSFNVDFDAALWNWKYSQGDGKCVIARLSKQGEIVAHYGGAPRKISYFGEPSMAIQPCDVMVHPSIRKQYGKGSLFFEVASTFLEREIGNTVSHLLGFGFPNQKTMNISKRLGLYEKTDDFVEIAYPLPSNNEEQEQLPSHSAMLDYNPDASESRELLDGLWKAMRADFENGIIGVRDSEYIQHRYVSHPFSNSHQYRCVTLYEDGSKKPIAFAVLKNQHDGTLLMDLICPVAQMKLAISILKQKLSSKESDSVLRIWITKSGKDKVAMSDAIVNELGIEIPCNSWNPGPSAELLYGAWWLTAGDMDFI